jgi:hypothetical protein
LFWIIVLVFLAAAVGGVGAAEKSQRPAAVKLRKSRIYQGGRRRAFDIGNAARGRPTIYKNGKRITGKQLKQASMPRTPAAPRGAAAPLVYAAPAVSAPASSNGSAKTSSPGMTVDFFHGILALVNASYENPNDALRQLRCLAEGGRAWTNGLTVLHQRMADTGDMRIDPFVNEHVLRSASYAQAMVLELIEGDAALTALLNMTLAEITDRGLQVPNTK